VDTSSVSSYQFGPYVVNPASGELLKMGERVRLQDQPFRLLVILLENAGHVVTRDEIRNRIWSENTYVDFDSSLRVAVRKLREALADGADSPVYIETIPKRGYRFLIPVIAEKGVQEPAAPAAVGRSPETAGGKIVESADRSSGWVWILAALLALGTVTSATFIHAPRKFAGGDSVVLADFVNSTGDPVFDGTLRQGMSVQLEQSPYLNLVSDEHVRQTLQLMGRPPGIRLIADVAREVCERSAAKAVLEGSIARLGSRYVLGLRARDCRTGDVLDEEQVEAARKEDVLGALDRIATRFRTRVGESLAMVEKHDTPLAEATTPSLEALKAYTTGFQVLATQGDAAAIPFFKRATALDPQFAAAYAALGLMYGSTGESDLAAASTSKAYSLRERASDRERFFITAYYEGRTTGNQEKAQQTCREWAQTYPSDLLPHSFLSGFIDPVLGEFEAAVEESERTIQLNPDHGVGYFNLGYNSLGLNRTQEAEAAARRAADRKIEVPYLATLRYDIDFLKGDKAAMDREASRSRETPGAEEWVTQREAFALAYSGRLQEALKSARRASDLAAQKSHPENVALFDTPPALWEALFGEASAAKQSAKAALTSSKDREVEYGAALAFALAGDPATAQRLADELAVSFPEDTSVQFSYLPTVRGVLALDRGEAPRAIEALQASAPDELGTPRSWLQGFFGALYPVYVRGEAYLAEHKGTEAAVEFQKIISHRGIVISDPIGALANLELGRAYASMGDKQKAKAAYESFLNLWKDADPDIPILKQARAEYRRLS
jgi:DNA-binding winged helix-turn-helix (wHTH) protein/tetratricopeptide (TPR) repeat protein